MRLCLVVISWVAACTPSSRDADATSSSPVATPADATAPARHHPGPPDGATDELPGLEGRGADDVLAELGRPDHEREFPMSACCTEFQIELYNTYPPEGGHADVRIREWTWDYDGYAVTLWLHEQAGAWTVLDSSRYRDDVEF